MIRVAAQANADTSGKTAAGWKALEPGRRMMRTPARPTAVASQRRRPTRSPRKKIDNAVTNSGETKPVADASAIGRKRRPEMKNSDEASNATPRIICKPGRRDLQRVERRARQHRGDHDQREHHEAKPGDLDRWQRRRQIFRGDIRSSKKHRRNQDQRDAAERTVGACRSGTCGWLVVRQERCCSVQPGGCGGRRVQGRTQVLNNRIGRSRKRRYLRIPDKTRKQEADMRGAGTHGSIMASAALPLQHRQAPRFRPARKCRVQQRDLAFVQRQFSRRRIVRGMFRRRGLWNCKHRGIARQKAQGDLTR